MVIEHKVSAKAADPKRGMSLDEVVAFVEEARRREIPGEATVGVVATWKQSIKQLEISG